VALPLVVVAAVVIGVLQEGWEAANLVPRPGLAIACYSWALGGDCSSSAMPCWVLEVLGLRPRAGCLRARDEVAAVVLSTREVKGGLFSGWSGDVSGEILAPILSVPAAVASRRHVSSWRRLPWSFVCILDGCGSPGEIPNSGLPGGRWRRVRCFLLEGIILESSDPAMGVFLLLSTWQWMSGQRPRVEDL
jgi:hypothetical protein